MRTPFRAGRWSSTGLLSSLILAPIACRVHGPRRLRVRRDHIRYVRPSVREGGSGCMASRYDLSVDVTSSVASGETLAVAVTVVAPAPDRLGANPVVFFGYP